MKKVFLVLILFLMKVGFSQQLQQQEKIDSLKNILLTTRDNIKVLNSLSDLYYEYKVDSSIYFSKQAVKFSLLNNKEDFLAKSYLSLGTAYWKKDKIDSAYFLLKKSVYYSKIKKDTLNWAEGINGIAVIKENIKELDSAIYYQEKSLALYKAINDTLGIFVNHLNISLLFRDAEDYISALEHINKAQFICEEKNYNKYLPTVLNNKGIFLVELKEYSKALSCYEKGIEISKKLEMKSIQAVLFNSISDVYIKLKEYKKAKKYILKSLKINKSIKSINGEVDNLILLSRINFKLNNSQSALKYINTAEILETQNTNVKLTILLLKSKILFELEKFKESNKSLSLWVKLNGSINSKKYSEMISEFQTKYQTQQKEAEILKLSNDNLKKETELIKSKNTIYTILSVLLLTLGLTFFFWYKRKQKQKLVLLKNTVQASEEEKKRIGKELHDGIASSIIKLVHEVEDEDIGLSDKLLKTYNEVRDLSHQLNNTPMHGEALLERLIDIIPESKLNQTFTFKINPSHLKIIEPYGTHIYRIVQELITNNLKHAKATKTKIQILFNDGLLKLIYTDNGIGITNLKKGNGFKNIEDRVTLMNGKLHINSNQEKGFELEIEVPYKIN